MGGFSWVFVLLFVGFYICNVLLISIDFFRGIDVFLVDAWFFVVV